MDMSDSEIAKGIGITTTRAYCGSKSMALAQQQRQEISYNIERLAGKGHV